MRYSPENKNSKPLILSIFLTVIAIISLYFAGIFPEMKWLFQLSFLCFATAGIQIYLKFVLTRYEYFCDSENLSIYKILGRRRQCVGVLPISSSLCEVLPYKEYVDNKDKYLIDNILNYTRNFKADSIFSYIFNYNGRKYMVLLEISGEYADYINTYIKEKLNGDKNYDRI